MNGFGVEMLCERVGNPLAIRRWILEFLECDSSWRRLHWELIHASTSCCQTGVLIKALRLFIAVTKRNKRKWTEKRCNVTSPQRTAAEHYHWNWKALFFKLNKICDNSNDGCWISRSEEWNEWKPGEMRIFHRVGCSNAERDELSPFSPMQFGSDAEKPEWLIELSGWFVPQRTVVVDFQLWHISIRR